MEQESCQVYFLGYVLNAGGIWKGDLVVANIEELEEMDASELHARRLNAKEVLTPMKGDNFIFTVADGTVKIPGGDGRLKPSTFIRDRPERREEQEVLQGESDGLSSPTPLQDDPTRDDTSTLPEQHIRHWMYCWRKVLMMTGTWMDKENYQMHGQVSRDSFYCTKGTLTDIHGPG